MSSKTKLNNTISVSYHLSTEEINHLQDLTKSSPTQKIFYEDNILKHTVFKFDENIFVTYGPKIGHGFWGNAYLGSAYEEKQDTIQDETCVIKTPILSSKFKKVFNKMTHLNDKMLQEGGRVKEIYGMGGTIGIQQEGSKKVLIMMPYLGELTLTKLIRSPDLLLTIPRSELIYLFARLCQQLDMIHKKFGYIHNDIRPDNIVVTLKKHANQLYFSQINFLDLGMAQEIDEPGICGDINYQSPESMTLGLLVPYVKKASSDTYALGKTLLKFIHPLIHHRYNEEDKIIYGQCKKLFKSMSNFLSCHRPSLTQCIEKLIEIQPQLVQEGLLKNDTYKIIESRLIDPFKTITQGPSNFFTKINSVPNIPLNQSEQNNSFNRKP